MNYYDQIKAETNAAIRKGLDRANISWRELALNLVLKAALTRHEFTTNDFHHDLDKSINKTHDNRALGGVMKTAQRLGWIEPTGKFANSDYKQHHLSLKNVWRSKIYGQKVAVSVPVMPPARDPDPNEEKGMQRLF